MNPAALPTPENIAKIFDFEEIMAEAFASVVQYVGIPVVTQDTITQLQTPRPRIEVLFKVGPGQQQYTRENGTQRETAWRGTVSWHIVTNNSEDNKKVHQQYCSLLRYLMPKFNALLNGSVLPLHKVNNPIRDEGTSLTITTQDGYWTTAVNWGIDFSVNVNAWTLLTTN